jgi:hypothetical protein
MNISPFLSVNQTCDEALEWTTKQLQQAHLHAVRTFDLHAARAGSHPCPCPNHGTEKCDCQMVILLVYGKGAEPETLILHGSDGQTWISFAETPRQKTPTNTLVSIRNALERRVFPAI